jgi:SpoIID/LytB domain protein
MSAERPSTDEAVRATRGEVLTFQGQLATAVYHAICGGHTESNESVWGGSPVPYLRGRPDTGADAAEWGDLSSEAAIGAYLAAATANCARPEFCRVDRFRWERTNTVEDLAKSLPAAIGRLREITPVKRGISGRIEALKVTGDTGSLVIKRELPIRRALGNLPSAAFTAEALRDAEGNLTGFRFRGAGWGHGVGMCQVGAAGSAAAGKTYRQILEFYYRGCEISRRWD